MERRVRRSRRAIGSRRGSYRRRFRAEDSAEKSATGGTVLLAGAFVLIVFGFVWKSSSHDGELSEAELATEWDDSDYGVEPIDPVPSTRVSVANTPIDDADEYWRQKRGALEAGQQQGSGKDSEASTADAFDGRKYISTPSQRNQKSPGKKPVPDPVNKLFAMDLSADLGGQLLENDDRYTWSRVGYFLQSHDFYLVFPNGKIPIIKKRGPEGRAAAVTRTKKPPGDPRQPAYRLVVRGQSYRRGGVKFYGRKLGDSFACQLLVRLERIVDGKYKELRRFRVGQRHTPVNPEIASPGEDVRKVYDLAVDKLLDTLGTLPMFKRRKKSR